MAVDSREKFKTICTVNPATKLVLSFPFVTAQPTSFQRDSNVNDTAKGGLMTLW